MWYFKLYFQYIFNNYFLKGKNNEFQSVIIRGMKFSSYGKRDCFLLLRDLRIAKIIKIKNVSGEPKFIVRQVNNFGDFYNVPISSSILNIYKGNVETINEDFEVQIRDIKYKTMAIKSPEAPNEWIFVPVKGQNANSFEN